MTQIGDRPQLKPAAKRSTWEILLGVSLLIIALPMVLNGWLFAFPIGVFVAADLLLSAESGDTGALLGEFSADLVLFALCAIVLYFGVKFLRRPTY